MLRKREEQDQERPLRHLFRFPHMRMWTKLRPGIWNFLEKVGDQERPQALEHSNACLACADDVLFTGKQAL